MTKKARHLAIVFVLATAAFAANSDLEQRFQSIGHKMVCVCGCTQILLECNHVGCPDSSRMISELRNQVASGTTDTSVFNWFAAKYGPTVLAAPIRGGFDTVAWIVPTAISLLALGFVGWLATRWKRRPAFANGSAPANPATADTIREQIRRETEY